MFLEAISTTIFALMNSEQRALPLSMKLKKVPTCSLDELRKIPPQAVTEGLLKSMSFEFPFIHPRGGGYQSTLIMIGGS